MKYKRRDQVHEHRHAQEDDEGAKSAFPENPASSSTSALTARLMMENTRVGRVPADLHQVHRPDYRDELGGDHRRGDARVIRNDAAHP